jgi:hypothetical protein
MFFLVPASSLQNEKMCRQLTSESYDVPVSSFAYASFNHGQDRIVDWVDTIGPIRPRSRQRARPTTILGY